MSVSLKLTINSPIALDKSMLSTDDRSDLLIIEAIKKHRCIWEYDNPDRHIKVWVSDAWDSVHKELRMSIDYCKDRWKKLRDKLRCRVKVALTKTSNEIELQNFITAGFPLFPAMLFLITDNGGNESMVPSEDNYDTPSVITSEEKSKRALRKRKLPPETDKEESDVQSDSDDFDKDDDFLFIMSLFSIMKTIPKKKTMKLRTKIQQVICDHLAEYGN